MTDQLPVTQAAIRYPFGLPDRGWRRAVKVGLGRTLLALRPRHGRELLDRGDPATFTLADRLVLAGWTSRATPGGQRHGTVSVRGGPYGLGRSVSPARHRLAIERSTTIAPTVIPR